MNSSLRMGDYLGPPSKTFFLATNLGKPFNMTDCPYVKEFHKIKDAFKHCCGQCGHQTINR